MTSPASFLRALPIFGHVFLVSVGFAGLVALPPAQGAMLLIPLTHGARIALVPVAVDHGARLVASGPYGGSMQVDGRRSDLFLPLLAHGVVVIAASPGGCGTQVEQVA